MTRQLNTYIDDRLVGILFENTGVWSFQYDETWVRNGFELSPGLPLTTTLHQDGGSVRPVQWFFDNLLPEEGARQQLIVFMKHGRTVGTDAWSMLESFGAESAGAITLLPPGATQPESGLIPLPDDELEARIQALPRQPLSAKAPKKMSLAGAQPKIAIVVQDGDLYEPSGARASTHILKPDAQTAHFPCSAVNEWFTSRLAQKMGLNVPRVELRYVPSPVYIIERFDRKIEDGQVERLHTLDAVQLLTLSAEAKYAESGIRALLDIVGRCRIPVEARTILFQWTLFNVLIANSDSHLKNISLIATAGGYELAPHYDLLSIGAWAGPDLLGPGEAKWPDVTMSYPIAGIVHYSDLKKEHLAEFARQLGIGATPFNREFNRMVKGIKAESLALQEEFEARTDVPPTIRASQIRMLKAIHHMPIHDMVAQLSA